ncbi:MAG: hypothetical protein PHV85_06090 [Desulfovibrionaceae bacterium]|nr:hypothetical protein [Desulfovibrionaceae bacterium]
MSGKRTWALFEDGRVKELDGGRPVPRNFPAEWGDWFVMQSGTRPNGVKPQMGGQSGAGMDAWPEAGPAAGFGLGTTARFGAAPAGAEPYTLQLVRGEVPVTRTDRPGGRPDRHISQDPVRRPAQRLTERITQRLERTPRGGETRVFQYDDAGRLSRVLYNGGLAESYRYDPEGRREREINGRRGHMERRFFYGPNNRLLMTRSGVTCASYEHDAAGFRSARIEMGGYGTNLPERATRYRYAPDGRLLAVSLSDGRIIEYAHDAHGRRAEKRINGRTVERYEWLDRIRLDRLAPDGVRMEFLYSGGRLPDTMLRDGRTYRLYYDQVGSLRVVADETGNAVKEMVYDSFGNVLEDANPVLRIPLGFAGGLYDPDTRLLRFGHRDYDPDTGRFTALDPLGSAGGDADWYGYCLDDPVNLVDPEGLMGSFIRRLPQRLAKTIQRSINPMSPERIVNELVDKEIERIRKEYGEDNATVPQLEKLKKHMEEEGLPPELESIKMLLRQNKIWPYNDDSNGTKDQ